MSNLDSIYAHLPIWLQNGVVSTYGLYWYWLRFGPGHNRYKKEYVTREQFSIEEWQSWQQERLSSLLETATTQVPYYQQTWNQSEKEAALANRLEDLPLLDKLPIRENPEAFLRQDMQPKHKMLFRTSGSTGTPLTCIWTAQEFRNAIALREIRSANWANSSFKLPRATFSGRIVEPDPESDGPFYRFNLVEQQVYFSAFHLRPDTAIMYVNALHKHKIQWLTGYAVSYYLLAKFILEQGLKLPPLKAVITTSEKITSEMRPVMEAAYGCRVYEEYSTVESALFAHECEEGRLHLSPDVAIVEILRPDGSPCEPEEVGEIITTCLLRTYQPFIRYRLGDLAMWSSELCPCGRNMPIIKEVVGRIEDVVVGPDGRQMVRFHGIFVNQPHVQEGQIIQETINRIRAKVVTTDGFDEADTQDIINRIQQRLGLQVEVIVEPVSKIPRTKRGKFQAVISLIQQ